MTEDSTLQESDPSGFESRGKIGARNENNPQVYNEIFQVGKLRMKKKIKQSQIIFRLCKT